MSTPPYLIVLALILSLSTAYMALPGGVMAEAVDPPLSTSTPLNNTPHLAPVILSRGPDLILAFYARPGHSVTVVYDQWDVVIYGDPGDKYTVIINNITVDKGNLTRSYQNVTYNAGSIDRAWVRVHVGNRSYYWPLLIVKHREIGYTPAELAPPGGIYGLSDIRIAQLKGAAGVLIMSLALIPAVWWSVKEWRLRQGVRQW